MKKIFLLLLGSLMVSFLGFAQYRYGEQVVPRSYEDARVIRISYVNGEAFVMRSYENGYEEAMVNLPVFDRDTVGTTDGRMELHLGRFNILRLDYDTEVEFEQAPALGNARMSIRVLRGGIYCFFKGLDYGRDVEIQTPDCGVFLLENGEYRISVQENYGSEISVYYGLAEVSGTESGIEIGRMYQVNFADGRMVQRPFMIQMIEGDDFLFWNRERNRLVNRILGYKARYLDPMYAYYEYELGLAGSWRFERAYNSYIWIPRNPGISWKPYFQGRWLHHPIYGMVWTSYDSWGWYTHYYGRWQWDPYMGWYWIPGKHWSPAWVSWSWTDQYYGWCPLSIWNRPVIVINNQWIRDYPYNTSFPYNANSIVFVQRDNLWSPQIQRNALSRNVLENLRSSKLQFRGAQPQLKHIPRQVSVIDAKGRTVQYKKSGFISQGKYNVVKTAPDRQIGGGKEVQVYKRMQRESDQNRDRVNRYSKLRRDKQTDTMQMRKSETRASKPRYQPFKKVKKVNEKEGQTVQRAGESETKTRDMKSDRPADRGPQSRTEETQKRISPESQEMQRKADVQKIETEKTQGIPGGRQSKTLTTEKAEKQAKKITDKSAKPGDAEKKKVKRQKEKKKEKSESTSKEDED